MIQPYPVKTPGVAKLFWRKRLFRVSTQAPEVFLTFDDGPTPGVTDFVLDQLAAHNAKATFFVVGNNVRQNPGLTRRIVQEGHTLGNHTYHHANGWKTPVREYLTEVARTDAVVHEVTGIKPRFFRPPYGKCNPAAWKGILAEHDIVLWDILPGDFDPRISSEQVLRRICQNTRNGSIIVLHDSQKCALKVQRLLPELLQFFAHSGLTPKALPNNSLQLALKAS